MRISRRKALQTAAVAGAAVALADRAEARESRVPNADDHAMLFDATLCVAAKQGKVTCQICWIHCPDACISQGMPPAVELTYCKGCGICAEVCPHHAIAMVPEGEHGPCEIDAAEVTR